MSLESTINVSEAIEKTCVRIVLQNGKDFRAKIVDVEKDKGGLHVVRLPSMRREVLYFGDQFGDIDAITPLKHTASDVDFETQVESILVPSQKQGKVYYQEHRSYKNEPEFWAFKVQQQKYFEEKEKLEKDLVKKIDRFETSRRMPKIVNGKIEKRVISLSSLVTPRGRRPEEYRTFDPLTFNWVKQ